MTQGLRKLPSQAVGADGSKGKTMKRMIFCTLFVLCLGFSFASAQNFSMPSVYATLEFPDDWLILTPASVGLYEQVLREEYGLDSAEMEAEFRANGVVAEGRNEDFSENLRLIVTEDERSQRIFDIANTSRREQTAIASTFTDGEVWKLANIRYQEANWINHPTMGRFLFLRYNRMEDEEIAERGIQYFTIRNGKNYFLEQTIAGRRLTNKDLNAFKQVLAGFLFTETLEQPPQPIVLEVDGGLPTETGNGVLQITGKTAPSAGLVLMAAEGEEALAVLSVGSANKSGTFELNADLPKEGTFRLVLTASVDGMEDAEVIGSIYYQQGLLPINLENLPSNGEYYEDVFEVTGTAPSGTQLQLLTDTGRQQRKVGSTGRFSFAVDTSKEGLYSMTLAATRKNYKERRLSVSFTRVYTEDQLLQQMMDGAVSLSYQQMTEAAPAHVGETVKVSGQVLEESEGEGEGVWFLRVYMTREKKEWKHPMVINMSQSYELLAGQEVQLYGELSMPYTEADEAGVEYLVPTMELLHIVL